MEMKNNKWMMASLLGGALLLTVGCARETWKEMGGEPGSPIIFTALSSYENNDATRTEYSGKVVEGIANKIERIDWVKDVDQFTVNYASSSQNSTGTYVVTSVSNNGNSDYTSKAGVAPAASSAILAWAGDSDHKFYAMYPSNSQNSAARLTNVNHFQGTLNPVQDPRKKNGNFEMQEVRDYGSHWNRYLPDMKYAYMVAYAGTDNGMITGEGVTLPFRPAVTTFEFRLRKVAGQDVANVKKFELVIADEVDGVPTPSLTGTFSLDISGGDGRGGFWDSVTLPRSTDPGFSRTITVNFGNDGVALPDASAFEYLDFTIFAVPVDLTGLSIRITDVEDKVRTLPLKDHTSEGVAEEYHTFTGAKKWVITNSDIPGEWVYVLEEIPDITTYGHETVTGLGFNVKSYKYRKTVSGQAPAAVRPVAWKTQYTLDDGAHWIDLPAGGIDPGVSLWNATFTTTKMAGETPTNWVTGEGIASTSDSEARYANILGTATGTVDGDEAAAAQRAKLATHAARGSVGAEFDLSVHPVYGNIDGTVPRTTANSYVVSAPGVYMFPCIYGNGYTNGDPNPSAYRPGSSDAYVDDSGANSLQAVNTVYNTDDAYWRAYTPCFYNAINAEITKPWIVADMGATSPEAIVVWEDTEADAVVNGHLRKNEIIPIDDEDYVGVIYKADGYYIWFKLDADRIKPGNFVIALRGKAGSWAEAEILWSWHIWITPDDLTPTDEVTNTTGTYKLMPKNMGWFDSDNGSSTQWPTRQIQYRIVQTEPSTVVEENKKELFLVKQIGEAESTKPSVGGNVYYQWGRKDPFLPSTPSGGNHVVVFNEAFSGRVSFTDNGIKEKAFEGTGLDYGASIREPYSPFYNQVAINHINGPVYPYQQAGTPIYEYSIQEGHEKRGLFNATQATTLQSTIFCNFEDWISYVPVFAAPDNTFYRVDRDFNLGPYTEAEKNYMIQVAYPTFNGYFTGSGDSWYLTEKRNGPFTQRQATMLNTEYDGYSLGAGHVEGYSDGSHWAVVAPGGLGNTVFELPESYTYHYGPYTQTERDSFINNGIFVAGDFTATQTGGGGGPYSAELRSKAANVTNLWNSYAYDENTNGSLYTNKFKTIYDPCPPGFTVPVKQVFIGNRVVTDDDRETGINNMHMKVVPTGEVLDGAGATLIDGTSDNPEKKGMELTNGTFFPYTGARIYRNQSSGTGKELHAEGAGTAGYYWTDSPFRMDWRYLATDVIFTDPSNPFYRPWDQTLYQNPTLVSQLWFFHDAYGFLFGTDYRGDSYVTDSYRVQSYTRASAFSVRPMKDPKVTY